jgi:hypothetical protein
MKDSSGRGNPFYIFINPGRSPAYPGGLKPYRVGWKGYPGAGKINPAGWKSYPDYQKPYPIYKNQLSDRGRRAIRPGKNPIRDGWRGRPGEEFFFFKN